MSAGNGAEHLQRLALISNEYATIALDLDMREANGPRVKVSSLRDHAEIFLDPLALSLICHADQNVLGLLADIARDGGARKEFAQWLQERHERLYVPEDLAEGS
jgi:hypothetical protein